MAQVFAVMSGQDMIMRLKFASINTSFLEICLALVPRMLLVFVTICVDLLLVIGIEDDSPRAMKLFVNWTAAEVVADFLLCVTMVAFKSTRRNVSKLILVYIFAQRTLSRGGEQSSNLQGEECGTEQHIRNSSDSTRALIWRRRSEYPLLSSVLYLKSTLNIRHKTPETPKHHGNCYT
ncbi:hypothetical protein V5799_025373 [Amblyomma americanum]|uniref:Uncharacterized protein n=1 Tax=Amblyomma americanum TaxID=6943 RepID=A0AAQ4E9J8_AMBAM